MNKIRISNNEQGSKKSLQVGGSLCYRLEVRREHLEHLVWNEQVDAERSGKKHAKISIDLLVRFCYTIMLDCSPVAQLVEQVAVNHPVGGSSPSRGARISKGAVLRPFFKI